MIFSYSWIKEYLSGKVPAPEKLAELLNMHAFEVEEVEKNKKDWLLDIDVLLNRSHDCLNHVGMAREIAAVAKLKLKDVKTKRIQVQKGTLVSLRVRIQAKAFGKRYAAFVVEGIKVGESPKWMKERLAALGVNSINNIVDITNYVMLEMGQPLHVFDYDEIRGHTMNLRESKAGEKIATLDEATHALPKGTLVIEDAERLIDLAGIKGGEVSGVTQKTKNIVFQAATFDEQKIYKTKKEIGFTTPAADLYAYGIDPNLAMQALERALFLLGQGKVVQVIDIYPKKVRERNISLDVKYLRSMLGVNIADKEIKTILGRLGFTIGKTARERMIVTVPTRRLDVLIPEDLIEEVGRMYGYEKIKAQFPAAVLLTLEPNTNLSWQAVAKNAMKEAGFSEVYNYSFIGERDLKTFAYTEREKAQLVEIENPISSEYRYMRSSLIENMLKAAERNSKDTEDIRIFEIGSVFSTKGSQLKEQRMLCGIITGDAFYEAKGVVDFIGERMGIQDIWYDNVQQSPKHSVSAVWHKNKSAEIKVGTKQIGFMGVISPGIAARLKLSKGAGAFHIDFDVLVQLATKEREYRPVSKFPPAFRDISILVPKGVQVVDVMNIMNAAGGELVSDIDLFDIYEGKELGDDKKSMAFHIMYQADNRTLKNKEVDELHKQIIKALKENPAWEPRT